MTEQEWGSDSLAAACRALSHFALARKDGEGAFLWMRLSHHIEMHPDLCSVQTEAQIRDAILSVMVSGSA